MAIYHCSIKIINRGGGRSAVASSAYRSGEKLYNEETGLTHDFTKKGGVAFSEVLLPEHAPPSYLDRQTLWTEIQRVEKRSDAQLAREVEVALPNELNRNEQIECVRNYINENFVSKGMIADWALHDKGDGNPHAHIMLTCRGICEDGQWDAKTKTVFANDRDLKGRAIYNPDLPSYNPKDKENTSQYRIPVLDENGKQKTRERKGKGTEYVWVRITIPVNDWNEQSNAEIWRRSWADHCNRYLSAEDQIDHRSYERQGIDRLPTIHEGVIARKIEENGGISERVQQNRDIIERNSLKEQIEALTLEITEYILKKAREIYGRVRELTGYVGHPKKAGADAGNLGRSECRNQKSSGTVGRIYSIKRTIEKTEHFIDATDQKIAEQVALKREKEEYIHERVEQLRTGRFDNCNRGDDGGSRILEKREAGTSELDRAIESIGEFLANINAEEKNIRSASKSKGSYHHY